MISIKFIKKKDVKFEIFLENSSVHPNALHEPQIPSHRYYQCVSGLLLGV